MKYNFLSLFLLCAFVFNNAARAEIVDTTGMTDGQKLAMIATLEDDILILDSEIKKCEKTKKGWIAATVVGSAGVVATGVAAGVQGAMISKKQKELSGYDEAITTKQTTLNELRGK